MVQQDRPPFVPPLVPFTRASAAAGQIPNSFTFTPPRFLPHFRNSQQLILDTDSPPSHENGTPNEHGPLHGRNKLKLCFILSDHPFDVQETPDSIFFRPRKGRLFARGLQSVRFFPFNLLAFPHGCRVVFL